jgi:CDP-paratose 2-epimerase
VIYGNGRQVRDILFVEDLVRAFHMAASEIDSTAGKAYNIGGGFENTTSLNELIETLEKLHGRTIDYSYSEWRPGDQKVYVSDISRAYSDFGWKPQIKMEKGIRRLVNWVAENREMFNVEPDAKNGTLDLTEMDVFRLRGAARSSGVALLQSVAKQQRFF